LLICLAGDVLLVVHYNTGYTIDATNQKACEMLSIDAPNQPTLV